jgi:hypothetical protein
LTTGFCFGALAGAGVVTAGFIQLSLEQFQWQLFQPKHHE